MRVCLRGCKLRGEVATTVTNPRTLIDDVNKRYRHTERERLDQRRLRIDNDGAVTHTHTRTQNGRVPRSGVLRPPE
jgi:hypothetical protein